MTSLVNSATMGSPHPRGRATFGEIADAMRMAFGDHVAELALVYDIYGPAYGFEPEYKTLVVRFK